MTWQLDELANKNLADLVGQWQRQHQGRLLKLTCSISVHALSWKVTKPLQKKWCMATCLKKKNVCKKKVRSNRSHFQGFPSIFHLHIPLIWILKWIKNSFCFIFVGTNLVDLHFLKTGCVTSISLTVIWTQVMQVAFWSTFQQSVLYATYRHRNNKVYREEKNNDRGVKRRGKNKQKVQKIKRIHLKTFMVFSWYYCYIIASGCSLFV